MKYFYSILKEENLLKLFKNIFNKNNSNDINIKCGTILEIINNNYIDKVMIITDFTGDTKFPYKILDLSTKDILSDFKSIDELKNNLNVKKVVGQFNELFNI